jgi:patatin-like phospholipase/acyl hydrolase
MEKNWRFLLEIHQGILIPKIKDKLALMKIANRRAAVAQQKSENKQTLKGFASQSWIQTYDRELQRQPCNFLLHYKKPSAF